MSDDVMKIRRHLIRLEVGQTTEICIESMSPGDVLASATDFARLKKMAIEARLTPTGVIVTRVEAKKRGWIYPLIDALEVGESHLFQVDPSHHQTVRVAASTHHRASGKVFRCTREDTGLRVTRITEVQAGEKSRPGAYSQINDLELGASVVFDVPKALHQRVRQVATRRASTHGVSLSCNTQSDGSIKVTRIPANDAEALMCPDIDVAPRHTKWGLERLAVVTELRYTLDAPDQMRLRMSVARYAAVTGQRVRCRKQDDGTMLVYVVASDTPQPTTPPVPANYH